MSEEHKKPVIWGWMLLACSLGCVSLRNNPALGISPLAIGVIEAIVYICIMMCVRLADWRLSAVIAVVTPVYLWIMRFLDAFMLPSDILVNLTMMGCMMWSIRSQRKPVVSVVMLVVPAFAVLLLSEAVTLWILKQEGIGRALLVAWNTSLYSGLSILSAALIFLPTWQRSPKKNTKGNQKSMSSAAMWKKSILLRSLTVSWSTTPSPISPPPAI